MFKDNRRGAEKRRVPQRINSLRHSAFLCASAVKKPILRQISNNEKTIYLSVAGSCYFFYSM